jgi:hypothetical protein
MRPIASRRWESKFACFIQSYGVDLLALELDIHPTAIYQWVSGRTTPRPTYAEAILQLASEREFALTMDDIYAHSRRVRAEANADPIITIRWRSNFALFIRSYGVELLAEQLHLRPSTICSWIRGDAAPHKAHAENLQRLALERGFKLTADEICGHAAGFARMK